MPKNLAPEDGDKDLKIPKDNSGNNRKITIGTTAPSSPSIGDVWIDTN